MRVSKTLVLSDIHLPFECKEAWPLVLKKVVPAVQPDRIFLLGDIVDFYQVSDWDKDPLRLETLQEDLDYAVGELKKLRRAAPKAEFLFMVGNHEHRLTRFLWRKAPQLASLRSLHLPELLRFDGLGVKEVKAPYRIGHLHFFHGHELIKSGGVNAARNVFVRAPGNSIIGHLHRMQAHFHRTLSGETYGVWLNPCLCNLNPGYIMEPQWMNGFTLVTHYDTVFHVDQVPILRQDGKVFCVVEGRFLQL